MNCDDHFIKLEELKEFARSLTSEPGVYLMKDQGEGIIYVGKAKNLKNRVQSYFQSSKNQSIKVKHLIKKIHNIEYIVTQTEVEAFLLEASLIKKHRPRYNIRLKDDKSYPYIKCSLYEEFPRFYLARKVKADNSFYYGPYSYSGAVRTIIQFLNQTFLIRDCSNGFMRSRRRPCLTYEMNMCSAPCVGLIPSESYGQDIHKALDFLQENPEKTLSQIEKQMYRYSEEQNFEMAAKLRDQLHSIRSVLEKQTVVSGEDMDTDLMVLFSESSGVLVEIVSVRKGRVLGSRPFFFNKNNLGAEYEDLRHWLISFLNQYYSENLIPDRMILPLDVGMELTPLFLKVLERRSNKRVQITHIPKKSEIPLMELAQKNAQIHFEKQALDLVKKDEGLKLIQEKFKLKELPRRIECYDVSHFQGSDSVASQAVFMDGRPSSEDYRKYKIQTVEGSNDFQSLKEVLFRRFSHKEIPDPQLVLVDGGKGQLKLAREALKEVKRLDIPVVSIAKARTESDFKKTEVQSTSERFFLPHRQNPVVFRENTEAFRILVALRDEAHRFAIEFHRKLRDKESLSSVLDHIPGLGPRKRKQLDRAFPTLDDLKQAHLEEIQKVSGINKALAEKIYDVLHPV